MDGLVRVAADLEAAAAEVGLALTLVNLNVRVGEVSVRTEPKATHDQAAALLVELGALEPSMATTYRSPATGEPFGIRQAPVPDGSGGTVAVVVWCQPEPEDGA